MRELIAKILQAYKNTDRTEQRERNPMKQLADFLNLIPRNGSLTCQKGRLVVYIEQHNNGNYGLRAWVEGLPEFMNPHLVDPIEDLMVHMQANPSNSSQFVSFVEDEETKLTIHFPK